MAFQFKRISPIPLPTEEEKVVVYQRMLEILMETPQDEWDEYLEPEEPLPPETEFVDNVCPECRGLRSGSSLAMMNPMMIPDGAFVRFGHAMECSRWKRYWPKDRKDTKD